MKVRDQTHTRRSWWMILLALCACALGAGCDRPCCAPTHLDFVKPAKEEEAPPPPAYLMVLYLVGPVALGVGAARVARWVFEGGAAQAG